MNDNLKVIAMTAINNQIFGLSEEGHLVNFNEQMNSWVYRASSEIKSQAEGNEFMKKNIVVDMPFVGRHVHGPGGTELVKPKKVFWLLRNYWAIVMAFGLTVLVLGTALLFTKL